MSDTQKESLELDVEELRRKLGPVKVALIEQWIREVNGPYDAAIAACVTPESDILDAGCSRGDPDLPSMQGGRRTVGADMDILGLRANNLADAVVLSPIDVLPFADQSFDVIVCKWVAEHLEDPAQAFAECQRVLRPGGALCILTPNKFSIFTLISASIPFRLKQILKGKMFGGHEEDTFRTWYRANSRRALDRLMAEAGLMPDLFLRLPGMWTFFIFNRPLALFVRRCELIQQRIPGLGIMTTYIVGTWRKPSGGEGAH